jgi:predicted XRE-type DNA-binding protein
MDSGKLTDQVVGTGEAARMLRVSRSRVTQLVNKGAIKTRPGVHSG